MGVHSAGEVSSMLSTIALLILQLLIVNGVKVSVAVAENFLNPTPHWWEGFSFGVQFGKP